MSAPLSLDASQLRRLADFLAEMDDMSRRHRVTIDGYGSANVSIDGTVFAVSWNDETRRYVTNDRIGS